jgi:tetraacyldisaccharide 4'-kinase
MMDAAVHCDTDRVAAGQAAIAAGADLLIMDDGFQHRRLHRDLDIVLLDSSRPFGNHFMIPRGSLREPPDALKRAHAIIFTRWHSGLSEPTSLLPETVQDRPIFKSGNVPYIHSRLPSATESTHPSETPDVTCLKDARIFAFSAIANNMDFHRVLTELGSRTVGSEEFPDHHAYTALELEDIGHKAEAVNAEYLVTTQKDLSKLPPDTPWPLPLVILGVLPSFIGEKNDFDDFLKTAIEKTIDRRSSSK